MNFVLYYVFLLITNLLTQPFLPLCYAFSEKENWIEGKFVNNEGDKSNSNLYNDFIMKNKLQATNLQTKDFQAKAKNLTTNYLSTDSYSTTDELITSPYLVGAIFEPHDTVYKVFQKMPDHGSVRLQFEVQPKITNPDAFRLQWHWKLTNTALDLPSWLTYRDINVQVSRQPLSRITEAPTDPNKFYLILNPKYRDIVDGYDYNKNSQYADRLGLSEMKYSYNSPDKNNNNDPKKNTNQSTPIEGENKRYIAQLNFKANLQYMDGNYRTVHNIPYNYNLFLEMATDFSQINGKTKDYDSVQDKIGKKNAKIKPLYGYKDKLEEPQILNIGTIRKKLFGNKRSNSQSAFPSIEVLLSNPSSFLTEKHLAYASTIHPEYADQNEIENAYIRGDEVGTTPPKDSRMESQSRLDPRLDPKLDPRSGPREQSREQSRVSNKDSTKHTSPVYLPILSKKENDIKPHNKAVYLILPLVGIILLYYLYYKKKQFTKFPEKKIEWDMFDEIFLNKNT